MMKRCSKIFALLAVALLLTSCGEHSFLDEIFGEVSSSSEGLSEGTQSSSSIGLSGGTQSSSSGISYECEEEECKDEEEEIDDNTVISENTDENENKNDVPPASNNDDVSETTNPNAVVKPLIQTKWNQNSPYNDMLPVGYTSLGANLGDSYGGRIPANCGNIAWAQLMKYHNHPARGSGQSGTWTTEASYGASIAMPSVNLEVDYDWNNMLDNYTRANPGTTQQRNSIATFIYHSYAVLFAPNSDIVSNFGYDKSLRYLDRSYFDDAAWEAIIKAQLDANLPVYYSGKRESSGHAFIVDGYDNAGKFHINWGWGGSQDGWYSLDALKPYENRDYNFGHKIAINIKPDQGGTGTHEMALVNFTADKITIPQNEMFTVKFKAKNIGAAAFPGGNFGVALVNDSGNIVEVIGTINYTWVLKPQSTSSSSPLDINCRIPSTVAPNSYRLRIVVRPTGGEWKLVDLSDISNNIPKAIPIAITAEKGTPGGGYGLALKAFATNKTTVSQNELFTVNVALKNTDLNAFPGGQAGAALVDNNGNIAEVVGVANYGALSSGYYNSSVINSFVPGTIKPGQYKLRIVVKPTGGEWKIASLALPDIPNSIDFTVTPAAKGTLSGIYGMALTKSIATSKTALSQSDLYSAFATNKTTVSQNELFFVKSEFKNVSPNVLSGVRAGPALIDNNGNIKAILGVKSFSELNPGRTYTVDGNRTSFPGVPSFVPGSVAPGQYKLGIAIELKGSEKWQIIAMSEDGVPAFINFTLTRETSATPGGGYGLMLEQFSPRKTSVLQNESFAVSVTINNADIDTVPSGQIGAALVDDNGNIVEVIGTANYSAQRPGLGTFGSSISMSNCIVPATVPPGQYKLRIVARPTGREWRIATLAPGGIPTSIDFEVQ